LRANDVNILDFIFGKNKVFVIPPFQRNYEWTETQCEELFDDIILAYKNNKSHYFGNIVYYLGQNNGAAFQEYILVDGQQRITTILLLLCALRDLTDDEEIIQSINSDYLMNRTSNEKYRVRLKQTAFDSDCFTHIINNDSTHIKNNTILNYNYFKKRITSCNVDIQDIYNTLTKLEIVDVNLQIDNDLNKVQTVFAKINSTGKSLEPADLIRNYLLLANTIEEQENLYSEFWLKIEQTLQKNITGNENISKFAKDYLTLNVFEDIKKEKLYTTFRKHFDSINASHLTILNEMCRLSKYYAWLLFEDCPNKKINLTIKYLNCLKTNDLYPLYLYLFDKLFDSQNAELEKILNLLSDFMLRYRIVSPSGGGGALRAVTQNILVLLNSSEISLTYDSILFELSNSATPSGRFPNNEEFKQSLMEYVDIPYARVALLKLEAFETKNIPVSIDSVTIEHLLPQTKSSWWTEYLGGEIESERIYEKYLNCIGNLAPISQGYNSKNSNKPWNIKVPNLKMVQFTITSEVAASDEWKEKDILARNDDISTRICKAITQPLERTRKYQSKSTNSELNGIYPLSADIDVKGISIKYLIYNSTPITVDTWKDLVLEISKILYDNNQELFNEIAETNVIHKSKSLRNFPEKDPIITFHKEKLVEPREICNTGIFIEGCLSADRAKYYAHELAKKFDLIDQFSIEITSE
jgi:uncharacterized protein with ParB-like and HNH nuclease domain